MTHTCAFTGNRKIADDIDSLELKVRETVIDLIANHNITHFITGGAMGFDTLAAKVVLALKQDYPVKLTVVIPYAEQASRWSDADRQIYLDIKEQADTVVILSDTHYFRGCMHKRNRYLVDNSSVVIAYSKQSGGGTVYTVNYAEKKNRVVLNL